MPGLDGPIRRVRRLLVLFHAEHRHGGGDLLVLGAGGGGLLTDRGKTVVAFHLPRAAAASKRYFLARRLVEQETYA